MLSLLVQNKSPADKAGVYCRSKQRLDPGVIYSFYFAPATMPISIIYKTNVFAFHVSSAADVMTALKLVLFQTLGLSALTSFTQIL